MSTNGIVIHYTGWGCVSHNQQEIHCFKQEFCIQFAQLFHGCNPGVKWDCLYLLIQTRLDLPVTVLCSYFWRIQGNSSDFETCTSQLVSLGYFYDSACGLCGIPSVEFFSCVLWCLLPFVIPSVLMSSRYCPSCVWLDFTGQHTGTDTLLTWHLTGFKIRKFYFLRCYPWEISSETTNAGGQHWNVVGLLSWVNCPM